MKVLENGDKIVVGKMSSPQSRFSPKDKVTKRNLVSNNVIGHLNGPNDYAT